MTVAIFEGLIVDERDRPVYVKLVGSAPHYVVDDDGFLRHIPAEQVDREVLRVLQAGVEAHRELVVEGMLEMMNQDDLFTKAAVESAINQMDENFDKLMQVGLPEETRSWLGLMGFRIIIDIHGDIVDVEMPGGGFAEE